MDELNGSEQFQSEAAAEAATHFDLERVADIPMDLSVEIGHCRMTVGETLALSEGSVITLERFAGEPVDLLVNGTVIARGEVVVVDEHFGLRVSEILDPPADGVLDELAGEAPTTNATAAPQQPSAAAEAPYAAADGQPGESMAA